jgi:hypothetical protein
MLIIKDNVLSEDARQFAIQCFENVESGKMHWIDGNTEQLLSFRSILSSILEIAGKHFDLSTMVGCEYWAHYTTRPDWHYDKDERLFDETGEIKTPICSIVYYPKIENLIAGRLLTRTEKIMPKQNRLIMFSPGIEHSVEPFYGNRLSVAINPWSYKLKDYK